MITSVYIHIPFCEKICHYCDFTKFFYEEQMADDYLTALEKEIHHYITSPKKKMRTIYVGGGTPTALNERQLERLLLLIADRFDTAHALEYTFEANPGDLSPGKIALLKQYGVNRISMGVQVFDDVLLEELGRLHRVRDVDDNIHSLLAHGINNISIDLMYGLPNQTLAGFERTLNKALSYDLPHYSSYSLQIEPKTVFYQRYMKGKLHKAPEELEASMFEVLLKKMTEKGKIQYEVSNFGEPGYESQHNLTYWDNQYYYGFGAGASGYLPQERYINNRPFPAYVKAVTEKGEAVLNRDPITIKEEVEEQMFLGLRKREGVKRETFYRRFGFHFDVLYGSAIQDLVDKTWIEDSGTAIRLTDHGQLFGNSVFQAFLLADGINLADYID